jgi:ferritin-like metal-binding protein YciE
MKLELLQDFYIEELRDLLSAEKQLTKALPKMAAAAVSPELRAAFEEHLGQTEIHLERLEQIFEELDEPAKSKKCKAMGGLIAEAKEFLSEDAVGEVIDVGLITAAQKVEHYEIAAYGCLATYAKLLGYENHKGLLGKTLEEEKQTDEKLTKIAERLNVEAAKQDVDWRAAQTTELEMTRLKADERSYQ